MTNPLSRTESNKMLFHDVFLVQEKEKLYNQISSRGELNIVRSEQDQGLN